MAQTMTASRTTTYQNNYPSSSGAASSVSSDMHGSWHPQSHTSSNGINGVSSIRTKPAQPTNGTTTANRVTHKKSDFYKNGPPAEVIVIDSESPAPQPQQSSTKRKRENSISTSTTVSAVTKRARKSLNDEAAISAKTSAGSTRKPHSVAWFKDERGVYRAREVIVPRVEEVINPPLFAWKGRGRNRAITLASFRPFAFFLSNDI